MATKQAFNPSNGFQAQLGNLGKDLTRQFDSGYGRHGAFQSTKEALDE
jgi:hypothetical protein